MKKLYIFTAALLFSFSLQAQIIDIPDANFKAALIELGVDTNNDGEIQISEAEAQNGSLNVSGYSISSLSGIEYFINIVYLNCSDNLLTEIDLSALTLLGSLNCSNNQLTSINFGVVTQLNDLICSNNLLSNLDISSADLVWLECNNNLLTEIDLTLQASLEYLNCSNNLLTSIDFTSFTDQHGFWLIDLSNNNLTTLDVSNLQAIDDLFVDNNELTSINLCPITWETLSVNNNYLTEIDISNSPNLEGIFCANNLLTSLDISNNNLLLNLYASNNEFISLNLGNAESLAWGGDVFFDGNPNLSVICTIEDNFDEVQNKLTEFGYTDVAISSYCSFEPNGEFFIVQGETTFDSNNDGCDVSDIAMQNVNYNITSNSINDNFISNTDGTFTLYIDSGSHTIAPNFENPEYYSASPSSLTVNFPSDTSPFVQDFCVTANGTYNDLEVAVLPLEGARPGFDTDYKIVYKNKGTTTLSGGVDLTFQDDIMDFVSATPSQDAQTGGMLSWNFTDLAPFEVREITFTMGLNAPTDTPPVNGDDILVYEASVNHSETDETPDDNTAVFNQTVVNSFDPNDKTCLEGDYITPEEVGKYVNYLIRFENTGTASAINIVVKDDIDITKYDLSTLVPLHSSHDFFARIKDQGNDHYIEFIFEDINLPFDDANNDGYVAFKIKTLDTLVLGDSFDNNAEIYFDYNFPIITNEATTTVAALSIDEFGFADNGMVLYPNPTTNILNLESKQPIEHVTIFDISGRVIQEIAVLGTKHQMTISTENLTTGTYFVKIKTGNGETVRKVMKD
ncbi:T9SS type A sorting domain-containing protein [Hanstruepera ponticola]|uniref:T9SS type A sorting domain-containing protein n=1 Tax=Hanstruepera ponticola TaxID=2042995 RepID=UPI000CF0D3A4|nr:T9SS type A sorting domain-containing protein [Hanstruepera ponticola]